MSFRCLKTISFSMAIVVTVLTASAAQAAEKTLQQGEACLKKFDIVLPTPEVYAQVERERKRLAKKKKSSTSSTTQSTDTQGSGGTINFEVVKIDPSQNSDGTGDQNDGSTNADNSSSSNIQIFKIDPDAFNTEVELPQSLLDQIQKDKDAEEAAKSAAELKKAKQEAYQRMLGMACYTLPDNVVAHLLKTASGAPGNTRAPRVTFAEGFFEGKVTEPGLVGLDGSEEVITDILIEEAMTMWFLAIQKGAVIDMPSEEDLLYYAQLHIDNALAHPDDALALRLRVWDWLDETILTRPKSDLEEHELRFINALEEYIRQTNVRIANDALDAYQERERQAASKRSNLASLYYMGQEPWDVQEEMKSAITLGGMAAGLASSAVGARRYQAAEKAKDLKKLEIRQLEDAAEEADDIAQAIWDHNLKKLAKNHPELGNLKRWVNGEIDTSVKAGTSKALRIAKARKISVKIAKRVTNKLGKLSFKVGAKLAGKAMIKLALAGARVARVAAMKAVNVVPVFGQIIDGIYTSIEQFIAVHNIMKIETKLKTAAQRAAKADWNPYSMYKSSAGGANIGRNLVAMYYFRATSSDSPRKAKKKLPTCAACFYSQTDFKSEKSDDYFCTSGRIDNMSQFEDDRGQTVKFNNKIRSVSFLRDDTCKDPEVYLYEDSNFTNDVVRLKGDTPDLSKVKRGKGDWDKVTSSVVYKQAGVASCEVCVYKKRNYEGENICVEGRVPDLRQYDMNNSISSIKFNIEGCPDAKLWAYDKIKFERHKSGVFKLRNNEETWIKLYEKDTPNVGAEKGWEDRFSSLIFSPDGTNDLVGPQIPEDACMVCMFEFKDFDGNYVCLQKDEKINNLDSHKLGDQLMRFANLVSSVKFITGACPAGTDFQLELYNRANLKGDSIVVAEDTKDLAKFDNATTSARLTDKSKVCRVCLYDEANYKNDIRCFPVGTTDLTKHGFNNKASSVRFEAEGCKNPDTLGVTLYENVKSSLNSGVSLNYTRGVMDEFKFGHVNLFENTPDLLKLNRGRKSTWNNQVSKIVVRDDMTPVNENLKAVENGCGVCFYDGNNYKDAVYCLSAGQSLSELDDLYNGINYLSMKTKVSSVKFFGSKCEKGSLLEASLYSGANFKGDREVVVRDLNKLIHFDNKAKSLKVELRSAKDVAKTCEVCLHSEKGFQGDRKCFTKGVENLNTEGFNNKPSSISLFTNGCKKDVAVKLLEDEWGDNQFQYIDSPVADLSKLKRGKKGDWDNVVSSFRFGANTYKDMSASNDNVEKVQNGCGVCLYEDRSFGGDTYCLEANQSVADMRTLTINGTSASFEGKVSSMRFFGRKCPRGSRLELELYSERDFKSKREVVVKTLNRLDTFDNKTESAKVVLKTAQDIANTCQVCLHAEQEYKGDRKCFSAGVQNLNTEGFNNQPSSISLLTEGCKKPVAVKLYENDWNGKEFVYADKSVVALKNIKRGKNGDWNNVISGFRFGPEVQQEMARQAALENPETACRVCFHTGENYGGDKRCFDAGVADMRTVDFNNKPASVGFETKGCKQRVALQMFEDANRTGDSTYLGVNAKSLKTVKRGKSGNWYRNMSSFRFGNGTYNRMKDAEKAAKAAAAKSCQVCFYTKENYDGDKRCFESGVADMRKVDFNNKPASVRFETQGCSSRVALQMFEDADRTGDTSYLARNAKSLKDVRRGKRGNWYHNMSSFRFGPKSYQRMEAAQ